MSASLFRQRLRERERAMDGRLRGEFKLGPRGRIAVPGILGRREAGDAAKPAIDDGRAEAEAGDLHRVPAGQGGGADAGVDSPAVCLEPRLERDRSLGW